MADDGYHTGFTDAWLLDGARTPFSDLNGPLSPNSPIDLGIKVARAVLARSQTPAADVGIVIGGNMAQASFDAFMLPRHVGLYAGVPRGVPAHLVQRVCGTGIEVILQAADAVSLKRADLALGVGTESMSRNPVAAYTHRDGFRMGQVEFKDFLWEALLDTSCDFSMGQTAENLAKRHKFTREEVDAFAARSFARALAAQASGFLAGEIEPVVTETFECEGLKPRGIRLKGKDKELATDTHVRPSPIDVLAKIRPAFGGVQTGGNSSGVVDGAAAVLVANAGYLESKGKKPLARILGGLSIGVEPSIMGIGPVPAIKALLQRHQLSLEQIGRVEINEAFSAQCLACARELGLDENRLNVNGGATAIGHPLGATGVRLALTLARELRRSGERYGIASACIGGGQGIALLIENTGGG